MNSEKVARFWIIGPQDLANSLLARFITDHFDSGVEFGQSLLQVGNARSSSQRPVVMFDCRSAERRTLVETLCSELHTRLPIPLTLLVHLPRALGIEREALQAGVRGFVYENDGSAVLLRAVQTILSGDIWSSRRFMVDCLLAAGHQAAPALNHSSVHLTGREIEVLSLLAQGKSNQAISQGLYISQHTVKTHLYKIYRKINVSNRTHAVRWALKHL
ncbi:response regulator transcription factor [Trichloromonas sp.]|uniref:helix-turn-helix transcriptional regulator n=1 Tax=Trichloromonas sp. TaxID=3069249 RepID=UPI003D814C01